MRGRDYSLTLREIFHACNIFSEAASEFSKRTRELATEILKAISETLGLEPGYIAKETNWDQGLQRMAANYYPACPEPDRAIGIPPHTDPGLVTFLIQNEIGGLQIKHKGKWVHLNAMPNAFVVNICDQMQVLHYPLQINLTHQMFIYMLVEIIYIPFKGKTNCII